jgi:hypothetical protein
MGNAVRNPVLGTPFPVQTACLPLVETVIGQFTIPAAIYAGATWRMRAWVGLAVGGTAGNITARLRLGSLAGTLLAAASTGNFTLNTTGSCLLDGDIQVTTAGGPGVGSISAGLQALALAGVTANTPISAAPLLNDMTQPTIVVLTFAAISATFNATANGGYALQVA